MFGLGHKICGELGLGRNRRVEMLRPALAMVSISKKWGFNGRDIGLATQRAIMTLRPLTDTLEPEPESGSDYFIGDSLMAVDFSGTAMSNLVNLMASEVCPLDPAIRPAFEQSVRKFPKLFTPS